MMDSSAQSSSDQHSVTSQNLVVREKEKDKEKKKVYVDGQWGSWSAFTSCSSECIIKSNSAPLVGVQISARKCDDPMPTNSGKNCQGNDKRVKLCDASQVRDLDLASARNSSVITPVNHVNLANESLL